MDDTSTFERILPLIGVAVGWGLSALTTAITTRKERAYAEKQTIRQREEAAAALLDADVVEVMKITPRGTMQASEAREPLAKAHAMLREAWSRSTVLADPGITQRVTALDVAMFIGLQDCRFPRRGAPGTEPDPLNFWPLEVALRDVRVALAAFQRRELLPEPDFPSSKELVSLAGSGPGAGMERIFDELLERHVM